VVETNMFAITMTTQKDSKKKELMVTHSEKAKRG
jgi:hypothetical protein